MRPSGPFFLALAVLFAATPAAAEKAQVLRAGDLMAQPFIDAAKSAPLAANQQVTIIRRQGAWTNVEVNGQNGWVRTLNLRLAAAVAAPGAAGAVAPVSANRSPPPRNMLSNPGSLLRTGSSGRTVTTGVKGLDEEDIRNSSGDPAQVAQLQTLGVEAAEARENAAKSGLKENEVGYLERGRGR